MDVLPETADQIMLLTPSMLRGRLLVDRMGRFECTHEGGHTVRLRGVLRAGRYQMRCVTRSGSFDVSTLMLPLVEWPTRRTVLAGPFDFDHTQYRMVVPTFSVAVSGRHLGLVWCEVPSPEDMERQRIRAVWGIEVVGAGEVIIELVVSPVDRERLRWSDVAEMDLSVDDRQSRPLPARVEQGLPHPRLLAGPERWTALDEMQHPISVALRRRLQRFLESGLDSTYAYRPIALALAARLTGEERWRKEAEQWAKQWVRRESWGYHNEPEIMGWNNDRDTGDRMFQMAVIFDWLHECLDFDERERIVAKLARHAEIAYRTTLVQKNYWYHRCTDAHGQGLWNGLAAAAGALLGHDPRAVGWLEWTLGNFEDAVRNLPSDGVASWPVFNVAWHFYTLAILEGLLGRRVREDAFFRNFAGGVRQVLGDDVREATLGTLLLYLASRHRCPRTQADAMQALGLPPDAAGDAHLEVFHPLSLLFFSPQVKVGRPHGVGPAFCTESGRVICRGRGGVQFRMSCGTSATPARHAALNFINRTWYGIADAGSFEWLVRTPDADGRPRTHQRVCAGIPSYRHQTVHANLVSIDARGHYLDGRWLGSALPLRRVAFLEHVTSDGAVAYGCANATDAYADNIEVLRLLREWVFFHASGVAVMRDRVETRGPRWYAWHLHTIWEPWKNLGPLHFATSSETHPFSVRAVATCLNGQTVRALDERLRVVTAESVFVPTYTTGLNVYKTADWQPELRRATPRVPPYPELRLTPQAPASSWELITVMGVDVDLASVRGDEAGGAWRIHGLPEGAEVLLPRDTYFRLPGLARPLAAAGAARPSPHAAWRTFATTAWDEQAPGTPFEPPRDLEWDASGHPRPLRRVRLRISKIPGAGA